ncbi:MAG: anaerobic ribonucleoside-triphosphate reductase activating protein [Ruminococcaceae bacterium]|nr:anaerobic ribonucleoside-triphosphate reductase activating protein [Oscillospiraceae bacterium]
MKIYGLQKTTLLDFPEKIACTVFTGGCNLRCPFCHNASLVLRFDESPYMTEDDFFLYIEERNKNRMITEGVCITGGEPLLSHGLRDFILRAKDHGLAVKLDTNGTLPSRLRPLIEEGLLDYIAMDIKNSLPKYSLTCGLRVDTECIEESIHLIMNSGITYEFRTTVIKELHTMDDLLSIGEMIHGAEQYYLQSFKDSGDLIGKGMSSWSEDELKRAVSLLTPHAHILGLRGV